MTYEEAETFLNENIETAKYHNEHLVDKLGYKIKDLIIAPKNTTVETVRDISIYKTHDKTNKEYLLLKNLIDNELDVYILTRHPFDWFHKIRLTDYLAEKSGSSTKSPSVKT